VAVAAAGYLAVAALWAGGVFVISAATIAGHRIRINPGGDQTVAAFAARLKDAVDLASVRDDLAGVVHQTLEPAHLSVWISQHN
jgi:hypothetical protein